MAVTDIPQGKRAIGYWFQSSGISAKGITLDQAYAYYDARSPSLIRNLGAAIRDGQVSEQRVILAMQALAAQGPGQYPHPSSFFDALVNERLSFRFEDAKIVAAGVVEDIKETALAGLGIYITVLGVLTFLFIYRRRSNG